MAHTATNMLGEQHPTKSLGEAIAGVDDPGKVLHNDIPLFAPFLNGEMLDLDMSRTRSGSGFVDHIERSNIVNQQTGWTRTEGIKCRQHVAKILDDLGSSDGRTKFSLGRTGGDDRLNSTFPCDRGTTEEDYEASNRSTAKEFSTMGGIKASKELVMSHGREKRKIRIVFEELEGNIWQISQFFQVLIDDTPRFGGAQISADILHGDITPSLASTQFPCVSTVQQLWQ